ncbi:MAG: hypothetical protein ABI718_12630 [Acidobacteriota bacterium]
MRLRHSIAVLLLLVAPAVAFAQASDRDVLLTNEGTLYTIESEYSSDYEFAADSSKLLHLTIQNGTETQSVFVPESLNPGIHSDPALAWDAESRTLFVFWQRTPNPRTSSDLLFSSLHEGVWSRATLVTNTEFEFRSNFRIGMTRLAGEQQPDGSYLNKPALIIHVTWWNQNGHGEDGGYAMLQLENGLVKTKSVFNLNEMLAEHRALEPAPLPEDYNRELFRHPAILEQPTHDSVELIFADWDTNRFEKISVRPIVAQGYMKPPVGFWRGEFPAAPGFRNVVESRVTLLPGAGVDDSNLLFYFRSGKGYDYMVVKNGTWSEVKSIAFNEKITSDMALEAMRKLIAAQ